jgi:hypothetical protein
MTTITASEAIQSVLTPLTGITEIRGPDGDVLGYFAPATDREKLLYRQAAAHFDPAEMKRRKQSEQRDFTIDEVLQHLASLEQRECGGP